MNKKLTSCPRCGQKAKTYHVCNLINFVYYVKCTNCNVRINYCTSSENAKKSWERSVQLGNMAELIWPHLPEKLCITDKVYSHTEIVLDKCAECGKIPVIKIARNNSFYIYCSCGNDTVTFGNIEDVSNHWAKKQEYMSTKAEKLKEQGYN